ncbi:MULTISPECIES: hypothetical protein [Shewanella]|uniref:FeoB-associated Cys-rich membrane protein n=1 Tax=Shewanella psychromarinicola TaxID=2487742 RepID=A0A3N4E890_9GAMM|nr:hypothetical protein [Shewanella psychromarinicola]AZG36448.1 hypothetical protein EGC80_17360 [Shewanella psychromarinicola]MCL1084432.1 hypothetical protein [Shewanella psychromarinicola]RPA34293.1 hypothetical protein EGC77_00980 [Shewanella psychromarinicola]
MTDVIVALTIIIILTLSIGKIVSEKRRGNKCIGCHLSGECSSKKNKGMKIRGTKINIKELK